MSRYRFSSLPQIRSFSADGTPLSDPPDYVAKARREIAHWERAPRGALSRLSDFALSPASRLTDQMVPPWLKGSAAFIIEKTLRLAAYASALSVDEKAVTREHGRLVKEELVLSESLRLSERQARKHWGNHCKYAAAQGAVSGLTGLAGYLADVPLMLSLAIREIRLIGLSFGYGVTTPAEVDYVLHVLRTASSVDLETRSQSLAALKEIEAQSKRRGEKGHSPKTSRVRYLVSLDEYSRSMALQIIRRGALHFVPFAGAVSGASLNAAYARDVGRAAFMCYRRRFIQDGAQ